MQGSLFKFIESLVYGTVVLVTGTQAHGMAIRMADAFRAARRKATVVSGWPSTPQTDRVTILVDTTDNREYQHRVDVWCTAGTGRWEVVKHRMYRTTDFGGRL